MIIMTKKELQKRILGLNKYMLSDTDKQLILLNISNVYTYNKAIALIDKDIKDKIDEFEKIRYEEQLLAIQGEKQSEEKMKKLQELYAILVQNPDVKNYFDIEVRFNIMIADVNRIIGEAIKDVLQKI